MYPRSRKGKFVTKKRAYRVKGATDNKINVIRPELGNITATKGTSILDPDFDPPTATDFFEVSSHHHGWKVNALLI